MARSYDDAIKMCDNSKTFFSESKANTFAEYLKKQGAKPEISAEKDKLNKNSTIWYVRL